MTKKTLNYILNNDENARLKYIVNDEEWLILQLGVYFSFGSIRDRIIHAEGYPDFTNVWRSDSA